MKKSPYTLLQMARFVVNPVVEKITDIVYTLLSSEFVSGLFSFSIYSIIGAILIILLAYFLCLGFLIRAITVHIF